MKSKLILFLFAFMFIVSASATQIVENYTGSDNDFTGFGGTSWDAQTFTIGTQTSNSSYNITAFSLKLNSTATVDDLVIMLQNTNSSGQPNGTILALNRTDSYPINGAVKWINFSFSGVILNPGQTYAIVANASTQDAVEWRSITTGSEYSGGQFHTSSGGSVWSPIAARDFLFIVYGTEIGTDLSVVLSSPNNATSIINPEFNSSVSVLSGNLNITNATLNIWYKNGTLFNNTVTNSTISPVTNTTSLNIGSLTTGSYLWNVEYCGLNTSSNAVCEFSVNNNSVDFGYYVNENNYSTNVYETETTNFAINITLPSSIISSIGVLHYNGTRHSTSSSSSTNPVFNKSIDVDVGGTSKNFFWELQITDSSTTHSFNTSNVVQNLNYSFIVLCNATVTTQAVNFTTYDAINPNPQVISTFKSNWEFWLGSGNVKKNYTYEDITETNSTQTFCISPSDRNFNVNADFEFDATGYAINNHYYTGAVLNSTKTNQSLYLLNDSLATITVLKVVNEFQQALADRVIHIQLYDIGTGTYKLVGMAKTNHNGEDIAYLNWYDSFYKFIILEGGDVVGNFDPYKVAATPQTFILQDSIQFSQDKFKNIQYSLYFNNATGNFVLTYVDTAGQISGGCLRVVRASASNYSTLYDQCLSATSGTLSYNIGINATGTYFATFYATGSPPFIIDTIEYISSILGSIYEQVGNLDGTIMAIMIVGTATMLGVMISPVVYVLLLLLGYIVALALGYQNPQFFLSFIGLASFGVLLIWYLKK